MKRIVLACLIAALLLASNAAWANPEIRVNIGSIQFGHIGVDYNLYQNIEVHNTGTSDLLISAVYPSCDCSSTSLKDSVVKPREFTTVRLKYNTKNWYGDTDQFVTIESNDKTMPSLPIQYHSFVGQWLKGFIPYPKAFFFLPGKSQGQLKIDNTKHDHLEIELIDQADPYYRIAVAKSGADKGETLLVNVIADESLGRGTHESSFRLKITASGKEEPVVLSIPVKIVKY